MSRADQILVARGLAASRTVARRLIETGRVRWNPGNGWTAISKPALELPPEAPLDLLPDPADRYVSRGGLKLAGALERSGLDVAGWTCLDVGQSTGGFTDCLLQAGAAQVVGVDVGHGQLHPSLRADPRVVCLEGINARALTPAELGEAWPAAGFDLVVADASFISLSLLLPRFPALMGGTGQALVLVKPQFEVGPQGVGKGGLVRDPALYKQVEEKLRVVCEALNLKARDWFDSPITGGDGNREFLLWLSR